MRIRFSEESGQVLVLWAAGLVGLLALVGLAVDVGQIVYTRTQLQAVSDAAALAAVQELPNTTEASSLAASYVAKNDTGATVHSVAFSSQFGAADTVTVVSKKKVTHFFLRIVGISSSDVSAKAVARAGTFQGGAGIVPWGLIASNDYNSKLLQNSCYLGQQGGVPQFKQNQQCTLKYGAGTNSGGDFGALSLGSSGASTYRQNIANGSKDVFKKGDKVPSETGNMQGPTGQAIADRFAQPAPPGCPGNDRDDVLMTNGDGSVSIRPGCEESYRIIIIPVVDKIDNPDPSTILGFAFMYLTGSSNNGGQSQVKGEFVKFVTEIPNGVYEGWNGGARAESLVE